MKTNTEGFPVTTDSVLSSTPADSPSHSLRAKPATPRLTKGWELGLRFAGVVLICCGFLCGYLYYGEYVGKFHLDSGQFPKSTPEYFVYGGFATYLAASQLLGDHYANVAIILLTVTLTGLGTGVYVAAIAFGYEKLSMIAKSERHAARLRELSSVVGGALRKQESVRSGAKGMLGIFAFAYMLISTCTTILILYSVPAGIAHVAAEQEYKIQTSRFGTGCTDPKAVDVCFAVEDDKSTIASGFLIFASPGQVALYEHGHSQVISLEGRRLVQLDIPGKR